MVMSAGNSTARCKTTANLFISSKKLSIWRLPFCFGADELAGGGGASWNCTGDTQQRVRSFETRRAQVSGGDVQLDDLYPAAAWKERMPP